MRVNIFWISTIGSHGAGGNWVAVKELAHEVTMVRTPYHVLHVVIAA